MGKRLAVVLCGLALIAPACTKGVSGPQSYRVAMDANSPEGKNFQFASFFPAAIKVRPGDSITFENKGSDAPHTLSFGLKADRSNSPPVVLPTGVENPAVLLPCVSSQEPTPKLTKCGSKTPSTLPAYDGKGYWNSGFLVPSVAPQGAHSVKLKLSKSITPGQYSFVCILHGPMSGVVEVVTDENDRSTPEVVAKSVTAGQNGALTEANAIADPKLTSTATTVNAAAGWGNASTAVNRFFPATIDVKVGQTVSWQAFSDFEPHTVSVGPKFKSGDPTTGSFAPTGGKSGSDYTGGDANSGIFGKAGGPFPPGPFTLKFTSPGLYPFVCILHHGMQGTVKVT